jgi:hypothetical protein
MIRDLLVPLVFVGTLMVGAIIAGAISASFQAHPCLLEAGPGESADATCARFGK